MRPSSAVSTLLLFLSWIGGAILGATMFLGTRDPVSAMLPIVGGLLLGWFLFASVKVVAQWERMIVLRLGKFHGVADPGVRLLIPILDSPLYVEMRVQAADIARQQAITQDNVPVVVNGVIFFKGPTLRARRCASRTTGWQCSDWRRRRCATSWDG